MKPDLLEQATRGLRETHSPENAGEGDIGRQRLLRDMRSAGVRRARVHGFTLLLAAAFVLLAAWAGASGRLPRWLHAVGQHEGAGGEAKEATRVTASSSLAPSVVPLSTSSAPIAPEASAPEVFAPAGPVSDGARNAPSETARAPAMPLPAARAAPPAPAPDLDALYHDAHEAHFERHDPEAALAAWNRYLAAAGPNGRMTLEARYNRAVTLVRLGRTEEARSALEPFARGEYGGYRRDDATRLLEALH